MSFAFLESWCFSKEIRSTTASIAELNSSTIIASKQTATMSACSRAETSTEKLIGIKIKLSKRTCLKAASWLNAALNPARE